MRANWNQLSDEIKGRVIEYLPQQARLNLLQTNYDHYVLTLPYLYRKLMFKKSSLLSGNEILYYDLTLVGSSKNKLLEEKVHNLIFQTRQDILLESLQVNPELLKYIEEVSIFDDHLSNYDSSGSILINIDLVNLIKQHSVNLKSYLVFNNNPLLHLSKFSHLTSLTHCMINHVYQLQELALSCPLKKLTINFTDSYKNEIKYEENVDIDKCLLLLYQLNTLILSSDELSSYIFLRFFIENLKPVARLKLSTLKVIFYHGFNDYNAALRSLVKTFLFKFVDLHSLKELELIMGCDEKGCDCMTEFIDELNGNQDMSNLTSISIIQKTLHRNHDFDEKFDVALGRFVYNIPNPPNLKHLSIRHCPPLDGVIENGVEGNFLRRKKLYSHCFLRLVNLKTLVVPSFLQSCSGYEVITSDLLWNGCRCQFCEQHLSLFDQFIINHNYYDHTTGMLKDVITPRFFSVAGDSISKRLITYNDVSYNCSDLQLLQYPALDSSWDFHSYFEFKHHEDESLCHFNQSVFKSLCQVVSHFEETFVDDLNEFLPNLKLVCLSGIFFKKKTSTSTKDVHYFDNVYDSVPTKKNIVGPHDYVMPK